MEDISVVQEFLEVLLEGLSSLLSVSEIEFTIKLAPGTEPFFKVSYQLLLSELIEPMVQM